MSIKQPLKVPASMLKTAEPYQNPVERLLSATGTTQAEFMRSSGVTKPTMNGLITGKSTTVSDKVSRALGKLCHDKDVDAKRILADEYQGLGLNDAYRLWRRDCRCMLRGALDDVEVRFTQNLSPFYFLVRDAMSSTQGFCKLFKVQVSVVQRLVLGKTWNQQADVVEMLEDVDYPRRKELWDAYRTWMSQ